jgi:hypothetical protein
MSILEEFGQDRKAGKSSRRCAAKSLPSLHQQLSAGREAGVTMARIIV